MKRKYDISDLDTIYLSYDEPNYEENWALISSEIPWAKHVHGVKGSDNAHKAAAEASETERFILIDGDNIPDWNFFSETLELDESTHNKVFRWKARNIINGLAYGNGGLSSWTKTFVKNMKTHENSNGDTETCVEFCFHPDYWPMHNVYSTTYPNGSPKHAWRAGFREGVKLCLDRGRVPEVSEFFASVKTTNIKNLEIWHNLGRDVENGIWAMYGARLGTWKTLIEGWDYTKVRDFDELELLWEEVKNSDPEENANYLRHDLNRILELHVVEISSEASTWVKEHINQRKNLDIMTREA